MNQFKNECRLFVEKHPYENFITPFLCCMVPGFPILELICVPLQSPFLLQEAFLCLSGCLLLFFSLIYWIGGTKGRLCISDILLLASVFFALLSIVTSLDIYQSLHGQPDYSETPLQTLGYFMGFLVCTRIEAPDNKKKILYAFGGMFLIEMIVGTLQKLQLWPWAAIWGQSRETHPGLAYGLTENSNFYGGLCVLAVGLFMSLYLFGNAHIKSKIHSVIAFLLAIWAFLCALFSNARLAWVGVAGEIAMVIFLDILMKKKGHSPLCRPRAKWLLFLSYLVLFLVFLFFDPTMSGRQVSILSDFSYLQDMFAGEDVAFAFNHFGSNRGYIWKICLYAWMERPLLGVGFDNLRYSFSMFSDPEMNGYFQDKAHNEYLHYLTTQGLFSCLNYLLLCAYVVIQGIGCGIRKYTAGLTEKSPAAWMIQMTVILMVFGYFSQALFSSSVTNVAVYKWILMGLALPRSEQPNLKTVLNLRVL